MKDRLPINRKDTSLPADKQDPGEKHTDDQFQEMRREFSMRFRSLFQGRKDTEIARQIKCAPSAVKSYLEWERFPSSETLLEIYRQTGCNLHWLLTGEGERRGKQDSLFTEKQEAEIKSMAEDSGRSFDEQVRSMIDALIDFVKDI